MVDAIASLVKLAASLIDDATTSPEEAAEIKAWADEKRSALEAKQRSRASEHEALTQETRDVIANPDASPR
jgi:hypothetical protein